MVHRDLIVALTARYRVPAVYPIRSFVTEGGLISYGVDLTKMQRRAATFVDRILQGAKPADLPVELPTTLNSSSINQRRGRLVLISHSHCSPAPTR